MTKQLLLTQPYGHSIDELSILRMCEFYHPPVEALKPLKIKRPLGPGIEVVRAPPYNLFVILHCCGLPTAIIRRTHCFERKDTMNELVLVLRAADLAARWHVHQRRKGAAGEPYINHLLEVANLVTQATNGSEPNITIAALLHDAIEDQDVRAETIAKEFGQHVTDIVLEVTDDKSLPKAERKRLQVEHAPHKSREAKLIKLADKISNVRAIADSPAQDWTAERRLEYVQWAKDVVAGLRGTSSWLEQQFDDAVRRAEASLG